MNDFLGNPYIGNFVDQFLKTHIKYHLLFLIYFFNFIYLILKRGGGSEREGEKHWCERETSISCLSFVPQPWTKSTTQACALTGNRTGDLSGHGTMLNQLSHTVQSPPAILNSFYWPYFFLLKPYTLKFSKHCNFSVKFWSKENFRLKFLLWMLPTIHDSIIFLSLKLLLLLVGF